MCMEITSKHLHFRWYEQRQGILNTAYATLLLIATAVFMLFYRCDMYYACVCLCNNKESIYLFIYWVNAWTFEKKNTQSSLYIVYSVLDCEYFFFWIKRIGSWNTKFLVSSYVSNARASWEMHVRPWTSSHGRAS